MSALDPSAPGLPLAGGVGGGASLPTADAGTILDGVTVPLSDAPNAAAGLLGPDVNGDGALFTGSQVRALVAATTTYAFGSATGVTLADGSVGGTAAVTGGLLRLTCPATPAARYFGAYVEAPYGQVSVPRDDGGRQPIRWRARVRVVVGTGAVARVLAISASGGDRVGFYLEADGRCGAENNVSLWSYGNVGAGTVPVGGTGWLEIEVLGSLAAYRYGTGSGSTAPTTWTTLAVAALPATTTWTSLRLVGSTNSAPGSSTACDFDDLTLEVL